jgi:hypothetical protein
MPTEPLLRILISLGLGIAIGAADLVGLFLTVKFFMQPDSSSKIPLAFFISEMVRLFIVLGLILGLSFVHWFSLGWLVVGPLVLSVIKYIYAFRKLRQL